MDPVMQHFKLISYMKKPKPWRKLNDSSSEMSRNEKKTRNVERICRRLVVNRASSVLWKQRSPHQVKGKRNQRKRIAEPPFLIRNCISGHKNWETFTQMMQQWAKMKQQKGDSLANFSFASSIRDESMSSEDGNHWENTPTSAVLSARSAALLRSYYTVWHIGRISNKPLKTNEETENALRELSNSPAVEKCLQVTPKGGIGAEMITDKSKLSKRALQTLSRWARMIGGVVEDGYESGYDDNPVELWNRAITLANASHIEKESNSAAETTSDAITLNDSISSNAERTPKRRRSNRLLKAANFEN